MLSGYSFDDARADSPPAEGGRGKELARDMLAVLLGLGSLLAALLLASGEGVPRESLGFCAGVISASEPDALSFKSAQPELYAGIQDSASLHRQRFSSMRSALA